MDGPKLCIMFRSVWMVLNSLYPRKLWLLTVNNLSPKVSINIYLYFWEYVKLSLIYQVENKNTQLTNLNYLYLIYVFQFYERD